MIVLEEKKNEEEAFEFKLICKSVLKEGSFNLRKCLPNSENLHERINDYETNYFGESEKYKIENIHKLSGVSWLIKEDHLLFDFWDLLKEFIEIENVTNTAILKFVASIFDPLGIIVPAVVKIKLLFQKLCSLKTDWDLTLSEYLIIEWTSLHSNLKQLKPIELPRFYLKDFSFDDVNGIEMRDFSDASLKAYGCVIYLKFIFKDGNIVTTFLCSKTKIKPLEKKSLTIPRLELMVCTLLSSLIQNCVNSLSPIFNEF